MARERIVEIVVPIVASPDAGSGSGLGVVAAMIGAFAAIVLVAVAACGVVSTADFGPGAVVPAGPGCYPFCPSTTVSSTAGQVTR